MDFGPLHTVRREPPWPFTEAVVTVTFTRQDIENYRRGKSWSRDKALQLTVGDVITDVKLPTPDFQPPIVVRPTNGWYHGRLREKQGVFSSQYVQFQYSRVPLNIDSVMKAVASIDVEYLCECFYLPNSKKLPKNESAARRVLVEYWLLNDPAPSWRRLLQRCDWVYCHVYGGKTCGLAADAIRHIMEPIQDTTFTLRNVWSTLDAVQYSDDLHIQLDIPHSKRGKQEMMNYYITNTPASWELLAGALYYCGERTALTKVTSYFQRQPEPTLTVSNLYDALKEVEELDKIGNGLNIPRSKQQDINRRYSSDSQRKQAIMEEFINNHPAPSWRLVADFLYKIDTGDWRQKEFGKYLGALQTIKQKYLKVESRHLFHEAMKSGSVRSHNTVALLVGSAGSGKTCSKHVILNEQPPEVRVSTAIAERPVKVMKVLTINGLEWRRLTPMQQKEILARIMASRGKKKVDLAVSQLPIRVDYPEPTKKTESKSAHPPPESSSSFPETETTKTSTPKSHTTTTAVRHNGGEESSEVLLNSPTTEEDFVALIDNSSGSEPIMEVNFIHLVDSGGQPQFHEVLPAFLRRRSAYIFVVNLFEELDTRPQIEYYDYRGKLICKACPATHTNLQIFMHCVRTLQSHRFGGKAPNIFVFGTHRDLEYKCSETRAAKNRKLAEMLLPTFEDEVVYYNVGKKELIFPLNAKSPEEEDWKTAREIRKLIMEKCFPPPDDTPLRWYGLEIALQEMAEALKRGVMSKQECFAVALRLHFDSDSFEAALQHLDELNNIFYYPNILPDVVFIDVQVLLDKVTELVKLSYELQNKEADSAIMAKGSEYRKFQDYALVTSEFLASDKFTKHYLSDLFTPLELVKLFRSLLIFADFSDTEYFMPCLLRIIRPEEVAKHRLDSSAATVPLILHFPHGGPLLGMFCSLIVYLLSSANQFPSPWKLVVDSLSTPLCLHRNCVKFTIPKYPGTVSLVDSFSFFEVHVTSHGKICSQICSFVCNAVLNGLRKAATNLGYNNSQPEIAYICPCQSEGLHPAIVGEGQTCWICTRDPNTFGDIDEKQQVWLTASAKALQHHPTSTTAVDPPVITRHPESQSIATRADTVFRVEATGDELQFQWQKDDIDIDHSEPRYQCNSAGTVSTLHIKDTNKSDKGHYRCLITNPVEKKGMLSTESNLLVFDPPEITEGPESQSVATGADANFTVEATGDEIEFQWQKDERNINGNESRFNFIRTEDTSMLCIQHTKKSDKGYYRCLIKNPVEKKGKPSKKADLSVFDPPKITGDPESQSVATGTHTTLRVQATGDDLQFQWQKDDIDIDSSEPPFNCNTVGNASTLHIQHTEKSDIGHYRCLIKNPVEKRGKASQEANLTVFDLPKIIRHPENHSVATGADTMFTVETTGDELQFQWQKDGIDIASSELRLQCNSVRNASTLYIKDTSKSDKGHYRCFIANPVERRGLLSAAAYLSVFDPPEITQGPESQSVATATDATFTVEVTGDDIEFQWQKDERNITDNESRFKFSKTKDTSTLCIRRVQKSDRGHYRCLIKNAVEKNGKPSKEAPLSVFDPPNITKHPETQSVATGTSTNFRVEATGDNLQFQWQINGDNVDSSEPRLQTQCSSSGNVSTLHIKDTKKSDKGHYRCLVTNPVERNGKPSNEADLSVWCNYKQILVVGGALCLFLLAILGIASYLLVMESDSLHHPTLTHSDQPVLTSHPNLPTLRRFPVKNGFIDIAAMIGTDYQMFGIFLLQDKYGNKVEAIEMSEGRDPIRITVQILRHWLQGKGKLPVNWQTLVQCLQDSNLNVISDSIKVSLLENNLSNELELAHSDEL